MHRSAIRPQLPPNYGDYFGITFGWTYGLTVLAVPVVLLVRGGLDAETAVGAFWLLLIGSVSVGLATFLKAVIVAALVFFPVFWIVAVVLPARLSYVLCASATAYVSAALALMINIDMFPPAISFHPEVHDWGAIVGTTALLIAAFVSSLQMAVVS